MDYYRNVCKRTMYPGLMESTHAFKLNTRSEIVNLVSRLNYHCDRRIRVRFTHAKKTARARVSERAILLPDPVKYGWITVEVILHEFAHHISPPKRVGRKCIAHGKLFSLALDALFVAWRDYIRKDFTDHVNYYRREAATRSQDNG